MKILHRQQFIKPKKDQAAFLEMEMKIQMQQLVSKENLTLSRLGLLPFYRIAKMRLITPPRFFILHFILWMLDFHTNNHYLFKIVTKNHSIVGFLFSDYHSDFNDG